MWMQIRDPGSGMRIRDKHPEYATLNTTIAVSNGWKPTNGLGDLPDGLNLLVGNRIVCAAGEEYVAHRQAPRTALHTALIPGTGSSFKYRIHTLLARSGTQVSASGYTVEKG
jgi:hypothetical protein